jgi:hypothetical protein
MKIFSAMEAEASQTLGVMGNRAAAGKWAPCCRITFYWTGFLKNETFIISEGCGIPLFWQWPGCECQF